MKQLVGPHLLSRLWPTLSMHGPACADCPGTIQGIHMWLKMLSKRAACRCARASCLMPESCRWVQHMQLGCVQVGLVSQADGDKAERPGMFRILSDEEVEEHLTAISERD